MGTGARATGAIPTPASDQTADHIVPLAAGGAPFDRGNLILLAAARAIPDPPAADIAALTTFLPLPSPTLVQTAAAAKALIRVLANYADIVPAQRATINVLADTIRFLLRR